MGKLFLFSLILILIMGCGKKSTIVTHVQAERLKENYTLTFPIDDPSLGYQTPIPGLAPIVGGIMKFVGNIFAKNTKMGKVEMSYTQPVPDVRPYLKSVRLKRVFFYMKPQNAKHVRVREWYERVILGRGNTTFDFLDRLAIRMSTTNVDNPDTYVPTLSDKIEDPNDASTLMEVFEKSYEPNVVDTEKARDLVLIKYKKEKISMDLIDKLKNKKMNRKKSFQGEIHILETVTDPKPVKYFLKAEPTMTGLYKRILIYDKSILIELIDDPIAGETFKKVMSENAEVIEQMGVNFIDTCTEESCLELSVPDVNLIPIASKGNSLRFDAILHADRVPESFKLKGFLEFDVKVNSPI